MAALVNNLEDPVSAAISTLVPGQVFRHNGATWLKLQHDPGMANAVNLETFVASNLDASAIVVAIDAVIDEV